MALRMFLCWPIAGELRPALLRSASKIEDVVDKDPLVRPVTPGHDAALSLGQHRHRLHAGQGPSSYPQASATKHGALSALDAPVALLDQVACLDLRAADEQA